MWLISATKKTIVKTDRFSGSCGGVHFLNETEIEVVIHERINDRKKELIKF